MIIDTHVHYGGHAAAYKIHSVEELLAETSAAGVDRIVQVTPGSSLGHTVEGDQFEQTTRSSLADAARHPEGVIAVIARLDVTAHDAPSRLENLVRGSNILGFRITSGNLPGSKRILQEPQLQPLLAAAEKLDTVVQIFAPYQIPEMTDIVRRFPRLRILVDHMGLRFGEDGNNSEIFRDWPALVKFAQAPNVWIKVSYFPEAGSAFDAYPYPTAQRYFKQLYEQVDARKLMWGSNFPPVLRVCTYKQSLDFVREHCTFLTAPDRDAILGGNFLRDFAGGKA
jgi:L-fuconolactonase